MWLVSSAAAQSWNRQGTVKRVSYTNGQRGGKLKWLPYRPTIPRDTGKVIQAQHVVASTSTSIPQRRVARRNASDPFNDPFGDRGRLVQVDQPSAKPAQVPAGDLVPSPPARKSLPPLKISPILQPRPHSLEMPLPEASELDSPEPSDPAYSSEQGALEESLAEGPAGLEQECSEVEKKLIGELSVDISAEDGDFPPECNLGKGDDTYTRNWAPVTFTWKASGLCHNPLYFEDVHLERYGHSWGPYLQPIMSGGHFFLTVPILPYKMGLQTPCECTYTLGYYRPGSCAPYLLDPIPLSVRAALLEATAMVGGVLVIP